MTLIRIPQQKTTTASLREILALMFDTLDERITRLFQLLEVTKIRNRQEIIKFNELLLSKDEASERCSESQLGKSKAISVVSREILSGR